MDMNAQELKARWNDVPEFVQLREAVDTCTKSQRQKYIDKHPISQSAIHIVPEIGNWFDKRDEVDGSFIVSAEDALGEYLIPMPSTNVSHARWDMRGFNSRETALSFMVWKNCDFSYVDIDNTRAYARRPDVVKTKKCGIASFGFCMSRLIGCYFNRNDLSNIMDLGLDIVQCAYEHTILRGAGIDNCFVIESSFVNCVIRPSQIRIAADKCVFDKCDMQGFYFGGVKFNNTLFRNCCLRKAKSGPWDVEGRKMEGVIFENCDLRHSKGFPLEGSEYINCRF